MRDRIGSVTTSCRHISLVALLLCGLLLHLSSLVLAQTTTQRKESSASGSYQGRPSDTTSVLEGDPTLPLPPRPSNLPGPLAPYQLLLWGAPSDSASGVGGSGMSGSGNHSQNGTDPEPPRTIPPHQLAVDPSALLSVSTAAAVLTLASAIVNPALCAQTARIYLILQLSRCDFGSLEDIEVIFWPLQFTVGGDKSSKFFTSLIFVWPFGLMLIGVHYLICRMQSGGDAEKLEAAMRKFHFPSLSITALMVFFWQPMTMSSVTVLSRGTNQWYRFMCFIGLLVAFILFSFAVRWHYHHMKDIEFLEASAFYERLLEDADDELKRQEEADKTEAERKAEETAKAEEEAAAAAAAEEGSDDDDSPLSGKRKKKKAGAKKESVADIKRKLKAKKKEAAEKSKQRLAAIHDSPAGSSSPAAAVVDVKAGSRTRLHEVYIPMASTETSSQSTLIEKLFTARGRWVDKKNPEADVPYASPGFVDRYGYMIIKYNPGRHWFLGVEVVVSTIFGMLEGVRPVTTTGCWTLSIIQLAVLILLIIAMGALRPYLTLFDNLSFALISLTQVLAVLFLMIDVDAILKDPTSFFPFLGNDESSSGSNATTSTSLTFSGGSGSQSYSSSGSLSTLATAGNGTATKPPTDLRNASDNIAFACFCVVMLKAIIDIAVMVGFWRKHRKASEQNAGSSGSDVGGTTPPAKNHKAQDSDSDDQGSEDAGEGSDDDDLAAQLLGSSKGKKKKGKSSNPLLDTVPESVVEAESASPLASLRGSKKGKSSSALRGALSGNSSDDGGEEMRPVGTKGKSKGGKGKGNHEKERGEAEPDKKKRSRRR